MGTALRVIGHLRVSCPKSPIVACRSSGVVSPLTPFIPFFSSLRPSFSPSSPLLSPWRAGSGPCGGDECLPCGPNCTSAQYTVAQCNDPAKASYWDGRWTGDWTEDTTCEDCLTPDNCETLGDGCVSLQPTETESEAAEPEWYRTCETAAAGFFLDRANNGQVTTCPADSGCVSCESYAGSSIAYAFNVSVEVPRCYTTDLR